MCERCNGMGYVTYDVPLGHPDFGKLFHCVCTLEKRKAKQQEKLEGLDGLTTLERSHTFDQTQAHPHQTLVRDALLNAFTGIYVLQGRPGTGKSHFLHCVVNQAKEHGRVAVYATMSDVLDYLRAAFSPKNEEPFEERWNLLIKCEVLCLDELDEFNVTDWAKERFLRLVDERWRNRDEVLTLFALNGDVNALLPKVASRLVQGRVLDMRSTDLRPTFRDRVPA